MTKRYKVILTQLAQKDLEQIYYYIAADSIKNARHFVLELEKKIYSLDTFPERQPLITENKFFATDYRHLIYKKYRIIYRVSEKAVFILRVIHGAMLLEI
ncbi:MAG: type II toxin-antitoxin system RelE/ParE family toxin [Deltaproteobacteria bacterium]|nr:type II toxin-antitoxin system RelE/ParE family toxin [Deltaproteobacteria bacterium]